MTLDHSQSDRAGIHSNRPYASRRAALRRAFPFALVGLLAITTHVAGSPPDPTASTVPAAAPRHAPAIEPRLTLRPPTNLPRIVPLITPVLSIAPPHAAAPQGVAIALGLSDDRETPVGRLSTRLLSDTPATEADPGHPERVPVETSVAEVAPFRLLREEIAPGSFAQLTWLPTETFASAAIPAAVLVAHGSTPGPVVCLTAAIHGDELNGIETVRRIMHDLDPGRLSGTVIGVPIVNIQGFHRGSRYLPDRRDLNRFFPGNRSGSSASRIAHSLFYNIVTRCNALVDLHTGSFQRANLPQIRADLNDPGVVGLTRQFGSMVVLHGVGAKGTLRRAATDAGIPAVTLEAGGPMEVQQEAVASSELGIRALLDGMGMYRELDVRVPPAPAYYQSRWVRTDHGGILSSKVELGHQVLIGDLLGTVVDPLTNQQQEIRSPLRGRVIGMAHDQFVMPGYATFHIGIEGQPEEAIDGREEPDSELEAAEFEQGFDPS